MGARLHGVSDDGVGRGPGLPDGRRPGLTQPGFERPQQGTGDRVVVFIDGTVRGVTPAEFFENRDQGLKCVETGNGRRERLQQFLLLGGQVDVGE